MHATINESITTIYRTPSLSVRRVWPMTSDGQLTESFRYW